MIQNWASMNQVRFFFEKFEKFPTRFYVYQLNSSYKDEFFYENIGY